jgi:hypothetical protein
MHVSAHYNIVDASYEHWKIDLSDQSPLYWSVKSAQVKGAVPRKSVWDNDEGC